MRGLGLLQATSLNVANMIGAGPFITIPLFIATLGGPHCLIGWVIALVLVICDGLVWAELGAALPGSGGSYHFLKEIFGRYRFGQIAPFLFVWQFLISGTLETAAGYIGGSQFVGYLFPTLEERLLTWGLPGGLKWVGAAAAVLITIALCRRIDSLGKLGVFLCSGTMAAVLTIIVAGLANFDASLLTLPPDAFADPRKFMFGLGAAMTIAVYDYLGYYNVCHLGDEVRDPSRTIPRAVLISVVLVACFYLLINLSIMGVVPWRQAMQSQNVVGQFMEQLYGRRAAVGFTLLILWTILAGLFAMTLGYSRILFAAARNGDFFRIFAWLHPTGRYPLVSLAAFGALTAAFCFVELATVIDAAVAVRIGVQFIGQIAALHVLRTKRPDVPLPFRMKLYPLPSLLALCGWVFLLATSKPEVLAAAAAVIGSGCLGFVVWRGWLALKRSSP
ncbi:MAG: APC family permease [Pirellulales bacterium]